MNSAEIRKKLLLGGLVVVLVGLFWWLLVAHTFVKIPLPSQADSYRLSDISSGTTNLKGTTGGLKLVARGSYLVRYYNGTSTVGVQLWETPVLPFGSLTPASVANASGSATPFMGDTADFVTPLAANSYVYQNRRTKAIEIADASGVHDVTSNLGLSVTKGSVLDAVVNILPVGDNSALVTTTKEIYQVKSQQSITRLNLYAPAFSANFYDAAYDSSTRSLFMLSSYDKKVYRYNLDKPITGLQTFYTAKKFAQHISAASGKLVLYSGNVPSTDAAAIAKYGEQYQMIPLILDTTSTRPETSLDTFEAPTLVQPSGGGEYVAIKQKFATTLHVYNIKTAQDVVIPSYDVNGISWIGDTLYVARDNGIWSYTAGDTAANLKKIAEIGAGARRLLATGNTLTATTLNDLAYTIDISGNGQTGVTSDKLTTVKLSDSRYTTSFTAIGGALRVNTQSFDAVRGDGIGDQATATNGTLKAAFPSLTSTFTVNQIPFPGYYFYQSSGDE